MADEAAPAAAASPRRRRVAPAPSAEDGLDAGTGIAAAALLGAGLFLLRRVLPFGRRSSRGAAGGAPVSHFRAGDLPPSSRAVVAAWSTRAVSDFLRHVELAQHAKAFAAAGVDGELLLTLTPGDMAELGVTQRVQRVRPSRSAQHAGSARAAQHAAARSCQDRRASRLQDGVFWRRRGFFGAQPRPRPLTRLAPAAARRRSCASAPAWPRRRTTTAP